MATIDFIRNRVLSRKQSDPCSAKANRENAAGSVMNGPRDLHRVFLVRNSELSRKQSNPCSARANRENAAGSGITKPTPYTMEQVTGRRAGVSGVGAARRVSSGASTACG